MYLISGFRDTLLFERGTDMRDIQEILGDSNSKTTEIYTHITNGPDKIVSPLDNLNITVIKKK
jgi:integrase